MSQSKIKIDSAVLKCLNIIGNKTLKQAVSPPMICSLNFMQENTIMNIVWQEIPAGAPEMTSSAAQLKSDHRELR